MGKSSKGFLKVQKVPKVQKFKGSRVQGSKC
jgi:hypothetical protein